MSIRHFFEDYSGIFVNLSEKIKKGIILTLEINICQMQIEKEKKRIYKKLLL